MSKNYRADVDAAIADVDFEKNSYQVVLDTTAGTITLDLLPTVAPGHCKNFLGLVRCKFYDGIVFHRVIKGFMIQGGCPDGKGTGGPGYRIPAEFNAQLHEPGVLSMARTNDPNSAGSQFFLCLERVPHLDRSYTVFGRTADAASLAVVKAIGQVATNHADRPLQDVKINSAQVIAKPKS